MNNFTKFFKPFNHLIPRIIFTAPICFCCCLRQFSTNEWLKILRILMETRLLKPDADDKNPPYRLSFYWCVNLFKGFCKKKIFEKHWQEFVGETKRAKSFVLWVRAWNSIIGCGRCFAWRILIGSERLCAHN